MIPASFEYIKPKNVYDAIYALGKVEGSKILAGGHSLIPAMKLRLNQPSTLIDISKLSDLNFIRDRGKYFAIGATATHGAIAAHKSANAKIPMITYAASRIGDVQVRNRGTIGGAIAHADPASDWPAVLMAANASIKIANVEGERLVAASDFFTGFFSTALNEGEIITEIHIPDPSSSATPDSWRAVYEKFDQPASRFAIVGCAVNLQLTNGGFVEQAFVAFNGVSDHAYRATAVENALIGKEVTDENLAAAAQLAVEDAAMIMSDHYADETYRTHLAKVICKRALSNCTAAC